MSIAKPLVRTDVESTDAVRTDLQVTYSNYKNTLQQIAQKIGDIEQEAEEHKYVRFTCCLSVAVCGKDQIITLSCFHLPFILY